MVPSGYRRELADLAAAALLQKREFDGRLTACAMAPAWAGDAVRLYLAAHAFLLGGLGPKSRVLVT